jgi:hypothetical protein
LDSVVQSRGRRIVGAGSERTADYAGGNQGKTKKRSRHHLVLRGLGIIPENRLTFPDYLLHRKSRRNPPRIARNDNSQGGGADVGLQCVTIPAIHSRFVGGPSRRAQRAVL